ncbi:hypothetical protein LTR99_010926 [Exophiala xenobiotica]|uniref:Uncharacterized protein n=1 Tax=Vermiconidia calcicola TaxID=1690605 RepID=A0AAV9PVL8_9PEZI|nr:hypothetical protein LTR96_010749 [Exophiala xenobiotica]KAK5527961.1 hypothetical protein LTR25_010760 [Vermiconidia calcicola]KAK5529327.1 hypothetical protein LTR23_010761 [Chaetothyriales sp. CCFEE 6169]KAK5291116.1 hypothetical protein LTR99_010926 [Exophiala xenobiotica]KAK5333121.1 hypothetical protein LTR98_010762 [Exophiala xenobiotica]
MHPPPPPFDGLRLASPADILRLGAAASGTRQSLTGSHFSEFIKRTDYIVLVVEDKFEPDKSKKSKAIIAQDDVAPRPEPGEEVIVGVACWQLWPGSHRRGQFQNNNGSYPDLPESKNRDKNLGHGQLLARTLGAAEHK